MDRMAVARELVSVAKSLVAGQRMNPRHVELNGEVGIDELRKEVSDVLGQLGSWGMDGVKSVKGFGREWIPYY